MLNAVFRDHAGYVAFSVAVVLAAGAASYLVSSKLGLRRLWLHAALGAAVAAELCLTMWSTGSGVVGRCVVNRNLIEPFLTAQGLWNAAMFVPIGLFGMLAVRRPTPVLTGVVLLTVTTEVTQGVLPLGRGCDTSDVEMNALGGVLGLAAGWLILRMRGRSVHTWQAGVPQSAAASAAVGLTAAVMWVVWITPTIVDGTTLQFADGKQEAAAEQAVEQAFGDRYGVKNIQLSPGTDASSEQLIITLDQGFAYLSWPDADQFSASLASSSQDESSGFPVPGTDAAPQDESDALAIAQRYAKNHYAWALKDSEADITPVGVDGDLGWLVSWRRVHDGILMPMRLDVQVGTSGRVTQLFVRHVDDPTSFPERNIDKEEAKAFLRDYVKKSSSELSSSSMHVHDLIAVKRENGWRIEWVAAIASIDTPFYIDATDGTVHESTGTQERAD
ncbi:hypothetical protein GCM10010420_55080 [Streptomyces glaucosporus]|uniref:VanZ-like domain-containing protein n=1 Tax=Streptomyces glaucosporus TaxID=284044 RepID=A0ABN3IYR0_9ACTN